MKTLIVAKTPTHHTSTALRNLRLKTYKVFGSGVHQAVEDFRTLADAKRHLEGRDTSEVQLSFLSGWEREEYRDLNYLEF